MTSHPGISVIIPVYNASKYLTDCLNSIIKQDIKIPYEVICVNDGSKDNSLDLLKDFSSKYDFIKFIDQPNGGATAARREGINNSKGEWITFVDADDYLPEDALSILYGGIRGGNYDIILGGLDSLTSDRIYTVEEYRKGIISGKICPSPWAKLYNRKLFTEQTLDIPRQITIGEDLLMNVRLSFSTDKPILYTGKTTYRYNRVASSVSHNIKRTPEYEEFFHSLLSLSIPEPYRNDDKYKYPRISLKINAWKWLNFLKISTKELRSSNFYIKLVEEIEATNYHLNFNEWLQVYGNSFPLRMVAIGYSLYPVLIRKVKNII